MRDSLPVSNAFSRRNSVFSRSRVLLGCSVLGLIVFFILSTLSEIYVVNFKITKRKWSSFEAPENAASMLAQCGLPSPQPTYTDDFEYIPTPYNKTEGSDLGNLYVLTYLTRDKAFACSTARTAWLFGYVVNVLGYRDVLALNYLKQSKHQNEEKMMSIVRATSDIWAQDPDGVVMFYDAGDTLFQLPPWVLMERYARLTASGPDFIYSAEAGCFPDPLGTCKPQADRYVPSDVRADGLVTIYPNAGTIMGRASSISKTFQHCLTDKVDKIQMKKPIPSFYASFQDDQLMAHYILKECDAPIRKPQLDFYQQLFGLMIEVDRHYHLDPQTGLWTTVHRNKGAVAPVMLHFSGKAKAIPRIGTFIDKAIGAGTVFRQQRLMHPFMVGPGQRLGSDGRPVPDTFECSELNVPGYRRGVWAEFCPTT